MMRVKTAFKWSKEVTPSQVAQLIRAEKDVEKALLVFDSATAEYGNGFRHDVGTFGVMISKLVSGNQFRRAEQMLDRMKEEKCGITEEVFLSICRAYGRVHRPLDAIRVFHKMNDFECKPSERAYITVFAILVEENQIKLAIRFYKTMREVGFPPSVTSLNVLIKALCKDGGHMDAALKIFREMPGRGCTPDSYTYGTLINGLCRLGNVCDAKELFKEMETKGCSPSVITYTCLIRGLCQSNIVDEGMGLFEEMKQKGIAPNVFTYTALMDGLCKDGRSSQAMELLEEMTSRRLKPNMVTYSTLINGLCKEEKLPQAVEILDRMKLQGLKPDAGLYGKIISGFCDICKFQEAANFLDEMILGRISPNRLTWSLHVRINNTVVQGLITNGKLSQAFQLYLSMRTRGISVDSETFDYLVKGFSKKGDLHKATHIINEMVHDGCIPDTGTWTAVVEGFWDRRKVREAFEASLVELTNEFVEHATESPKEDL
ncbi:hypothetical protein Tsubulata_012692 [Turnera subulata]|uniref:Pentacotripeptide-repeat region of PRORP domain-containing protein n=1 Tax=Turnera subulata TaxID=218843 RepID=A0A9Q0FY30_9ROSI|nr:hypothetical protein Tsubulata_012692 [Turnera subulata]